MSRRTAGLRAQLAELRASATPLLRFVAVHQRLVTSALVGVAVLSGLQVMRPDSARLQPVVAAARALPAGARLTADDLTLVRLPKAAAPADVVPDVARLVGRVLAGSVGAREPLTEQRLLGAGLTAGLAPGQVAAPVRLADPTAARLARAGDLVDLLAVGAEGGPATIVARAATVLAVSAADEGFEDGALVVVAVSRETAAVLASAAATSRISLLLSPR